MKTPQNDDVRQIPGRRNVLLVASLCGNVFALFVLVVVFISQSDVHAPSSFSSSRQRLAGSGNAISKIYVEVRLADTSEAYKTALDGDFSKCNSLSAADITVTDPASGDVLASARDTGSRLIALSRPSARARIVLTRQGYSQVSQECLATKPDDTFHVSAILKKDGI